MAMLCQTFFQMPRVGETVELKVKVFSPHREAARLSCFVGLQSTLIPIHSRMHFDPSKETRYLFFPPNIFGRWRRCWKAELAS